jgi:hypothetical protein
MLDTPSEDLAAITKAVTEGSVVVCLTRCWPCQFSEHHTPPKPHTWMDPDDAEHAGHSWPLPAEVAAKNVCACPCAKENPDA